MFKRIVCLHLKKKKPIKDVKLESNSKTLSIDVKIWLILLIFWFKKLIRWSARENIDRIRY